MGNPEMTTNGERIVQFTRTLWRSLKQHFGYGNPLIDALRKHRALVLFYIAVLLIPHLTRILSFFVSFAPYGGFLSNNITIWPFFDLLFAAGLLLTLFQKTDTKTLFIRGFLIVGYLSVLVRGILSLLLTFSNLTPLPLFLAMQIVSLMSLMSLIFADGCFLTLLLGGRFSPKLLKILSAFIIAAFAVNMGKNAVSFYSLFSSCADAASYAGATPGTILSVFEAFDEPFFRVLFWSIISNVLASLGYIATFLLSFFAVRTLRGGLPTPQPSDVTRYNTRLAGTPYEIQSSSPQSKDPETHI